jgi:hypothetical protein
MGSAVNGPAETRATDSYHRRPRPSCSSGAALVAEGIDARLAAADAGTDAEATAWPIGGPGRRPSPLASGSIPFARS